MTSVNALIRKSAWVAIAALAVPCSGFIPRKAGSHACSLMCPVDLALVHAQQEITTLKVGKPLERTLAGGQKHVYQLEMAQGQYASITVEQRGVDVIVQVQGVAQEALLDIDRESRNQGLEQVEFVAEKAGTYRLEVRPVLKCASAAYVIQLNEVHPATERDRMVFESDRLYREATLLRRSGKLDDAIPRYDRALEIIKQTLGTGNQRFTRALQQLAAVYAAKRDYAKADALHQRAIEMNERTFGPDHPEVAYSLNLMAGYYTDNSEPEKAILLFQRALQIREKTLDPNHSALGYTLCNLGVSLSNALDYVRGEQMYLRSLPILEKSLGDDNLDYAGALHDLAFLYDTIGDSAKAEQFYQRELTSTEKVKGKDSLEVSIVLDYIARVNLRQGDDDKAEAAYQRGLEIRQKFKWESGVLGALSNLAGIYANRGDTRRAEEMLKRALEGREKESPKNPEMVANELVNLGDLNNGKGDYAVAEQYINRAISTLETLTKVDNLDLAHCLVSLATTHIGRGNYTAAEQSSRRALGIFEKINGPDHPYVAQALGELGRIAYLRGDYAGAEAAYGRALAIVEKSSGKNGQGILEPLTGLADVYTASRDLAHALEVQSRALSVAEHNLSLALETGSERQKLTYLAAAGSHIDRNLTFNIRESPADPGAAELGLITALRFKGRVLDAMTETLSALRSRANAEDKALLDELNDTTTQLAGRVLTTSSSPAPDAARAQIQSQIQSLTDKKEKLEDEMSRRSAQFRVHKQPVTLDSIRRAIPDRAALVEIVIYRPVDPKAKSAAPGEPRYAAYVARNQGDVRCRDLGPAREVDGAIDSLRRALREPQDKDVRRLARSLDERVMQPIRTLLGNATQLLISPDGELNLVPFEALIDEQGRYLIERYSMSYLTSGRDLSRMQVARASKSQPMVMADPAFGEPEIAQAGPEGTPRAKQASVRTKRQSVTTGDDLSSVYFAPLAGTAEEARAIKVLLPEAKVLTGQQATKSALKQAEAPGILHIATHGFFLRYATDNLQHQAAGTTIPMGTGTRAISASARVDNPLLRSGLALAGANLNQGSDDGVLTAMEASGLNLWGTKLVTLSACDTGLGEVKNGEGVFGLRRAFVLAGAETLVMSLWPVSDYVTREIMTEYYKGLKEGLGRGEALRRVKLAMLKRKHRHPFYWASFIQSGEWANLDGKR